MTKNMVKKCIVLICIFTASVCLFANGKPGPTDPRLWEAGEAFTTIRNDDISIEKEFLLIDITPDVRTIKVHYEYRNHSNKDITLSYAFPVTHIVKPELLWEYFGYNSGPDSEKGSFMYDIYQTLHSGTFESKVIPFTENTPFNYSVSRNGQVVKPNALVIQGTRADSRYWSINKKVTIYFLSDITFKANATTKVNVTYNLPEGIDGPYQAMYAPNMPVEYIIGTGSLWKDSIKELTVQVNTYDQIIDSHIDLPLVYSGAGCYVYHIKDYEPGLEKVLSFKTMYQFSSASLSSSFSPYSFEGIQVYDAHLYNGLPTSDAEGLGKIPDFVSLQPASFIDGTYPVFSAYEKDVQFDFRPESAFDRSLATAWSPNDPEKDYIEFTSDYPFVINEVITGFTPIDLVAWYSRILGNNTADTSFDNYSDVRSNVLDAYKEYAYLQERETEVTLTNISSNEIIELQVKHLISPPEERPGRDVQQPVLITEGEDESQYYNPQLKRMLVYPAGSYRISLPKGGALCHFDIKPVGGIWQNAGLDESHIGYLTEYSNIFKIMESLENEGLFIIGNK